MLSNLFFQGHFGSGLEKISRINEKEKERKSSIKLLYEETRQSL